MRSFRYLPRFRAAYRSLGELAERETWPRARIEEYQLAHINSIWQQAARDVPYYRDLAAQHNLPDRFGCLDEFRQRVPVLTKETVRDAPGRLLSRKRERGRWHSSSGSSGRASRVFWPREGHWEVLRARYRFYAAWGIDVFDRMAFLWNDDSEPKNRLAACCGRLCQAVEDCLRNRIRLSALQLGRDRLRRYLDRLAAFRPAALYAYSTAAYLLAQEAERTGFRLDSLKVVFLTAETASPRMIQTIRRALGVPTAIEYGASECGFIAGQWPDGTLRVREDIALLETAPRDDGRLDILLTVLANPSFPLLRFAIGDTTDGPLEFPASAPAVLMNIAGRNNDLLLTRSGQPLHPDLFDSIIERCERLRRWRVHQRRDGSVRVALEPAQAGDHVDTADMVQALSQQLEGYPVTVDVVDMIPPCPGGKHRWIVSDLVCR